MRYLILNPAPAFVPPDDFEGEAPTQAVLNRRHAQDISEKVWAMKHPSPPAGTVTRAYTGYVQHPDGRVALQVLGEAVQQEVDGETVTTFTDSMRVHPDANENAMVEAIGDAVTSDERKGMKGKLKKAKGSGASLLAFALSTPSLSKKLKTHEQMEADGWFPDPEIS